MHVHTSLYEVWLRSRSTCCKWTRTLRILPNCQMGLMPVTVDDWQMPKGSAPGDLVCRWPSAVHSLRMVEANPVKVEQGPGPYRGPVAGMQWIDPVDRKKVIRAAASTADYRLTKQ